MLVSRDQRQMLKSHPQADTHVFVASLPIPCDTARRTCPELNKGTQIAVQTEECHLKRVSSDVSTSPCRQQE